MTGITRRILLGAAAAAVVVPAGLVAEEESALVFDVYRDGEPIGTHSIAFQHRGDTLTVDIAIEFEVVFAWVPVFRYSHRNREVWRAGRLERLDSETYDDGIDHRVAVRRIGETLFIVAADTERTVDGDLMTTGYWHPRTFEQTRLIDTQTGEVLEVVHRANGDDAIVVAGTTIEARRFDVTGDLEMTTWYSADGLWSGLAFDARGSEIDYRARQRPGAQAWQAVVASTEA